MKIVEKFEDMILTYAENCNGKSNVLFGHEVTIPQELKAQFQQENAEQEK